MAWQVLALAFLYGLGIVHGQIVYSVPEEMPKGSIVGNIAQDLGLDVSRLKSGKARLYTGDGTEYVDLMKDKGVLFIKDRIDRESLCGQTTPCALHFQIILENPMEFYSVTVQITDINDNAPFFSVDKMAFEISESSLLGARFTLEKAIDSDVGINGLQGYALNPSDIFELETTTQTDDVKSVVMILKKSLDREKEESLSLVLTATDGGDPQMSGTVQIHIKVLDANDNAPVCSQRVYKVSVVENAAKGTMLNTVQASDADEGLNGRVSYALSKPTSEVNGLFEIDYTTGVVKLIGETNYEKTKRYQLDVLAKDHGGHSDTCKVIIDVIDANDNSPVINVMSKLATIPENSKAGTVVSILNIHDQDSGDNGHVQCSINDNMPFILKSTSNNFYSLVTDSELDRERESVFNISVTCTDEGSPPLSSSMTLSLQISDVNDNAPVFERSSYEASIPENNSPGISVFTVKATDVDFNQNARISYMLEETTINGAAASSYVSVNAESGVIHAVRSFDYEQIKQFHFHVKAQDGGSPPLSTNVSVRINIQDQNDNAPQILYPVQSSGSLVAEIVPRSADVGYLVSKVVAVDVDSGQNAWLSYKLLKGSERVLFEVGTQNGEIRTVRQVTDKDAVKQKLAIVVEDNGQPSRSATVNVNVALADSFPEVLSEFTDFTRDKEYNDNLTFYLVLALAVVSFLFIVSIIAILSVKCYRWRRERMFYKSNGNLPVIPYYPPLYADVGGTGTLQHVYNYEVYGTTDSRRSDVKCRRPCNESIVSLDAAGTLPHVNTDKLLMDDQVSLLL
ncbi:protocadherin gamma-A11-like [Engraulis encrasicolus]|uniref:protocadherin gamma-A11-like n=1 Tax=Engraulis encrasicolus TaxID=184585 RepID=UPI002FD58AE0